MTSAGSRDFFALFPSLPLHLPQPFVDSGLAGADFLGDLPGAEALRGEPGDLRQQFVFLRPGSG
jgi:hypothetical protein